MHLYVYVCVYNKASDAKSFSGCLAMKCMQGCLIFNNRMTKG